MFVATFTFINNSTTISKRGLVNGIAIGVASVFKGLGPTAGGCLFAWTLRNETFPFDIHGAWLFMSMVYCVVFGMSLWLPESINRQKPEGA
jgi:hypothetical protein